MGKFRQCLTELSVLDTIMPRYYSLTFLLDLLALKSVNIYFHIEIIYSCTIMGRDMEGLFLELQQGKGS